VPVADSAHARGWKNKPPGPTSHHCPGRPLHHHRARRRPEAAGGLHGGPQDTALVSGVLHTTGATDKLQKVDQEKVAILRTTSDRANCAILEARRASLNWQGSGLEIHHRVSGIGVRIPGPPPLLNHLRELTFGTLIAVAVSLPDSCTESCRASMQSATRATPARRSFPRAM
jgi:hypothetical protein